MPLSVSLRRHRRGSLALATLALFGLLMPAGVVAAKPPAPAPVNIQLLNVSDWHGQIDPQIVRLSGVDTPVGGSWSIGPRWDEDSASIPTLRLTAGDDFGASPPLSSFFDEAPGVLSERLMGIQVSTFGNHNFDKGISHLQSMIDLAAAPTDADHPGTPYQYVAANLQNLALNLTGVEPFALFKVGGVKVAVIGIVNEEAPTLVSPGNFGTMLVTDGVAAANKYAAIARKAGANVVVVATHKGVRGQDLDGNWFGELVDFSSGIDSDLIDVVIGDHTDIQYSGSINGVLVHEAKSKGVSYAKTQIQARPGRDGGVLSKSVSFVTPVTPARTSAQLVAAECPTGTGSPDRYCDAEALEVLADPYRPDLAVLLDPKIATATGRFIRRDAADNPGNSERTREIPLGNLVAEGMLWFEDTDFAIMNSGGIRDSIPSAYAPLNGSLVRPPAAAPWDVVLGDVYSVLPFANTVLRREVTGAQLWSALENAVSQISPSTGLGTDGRFAQIAGFRFAFDYAKSTGCSGTSGAASWVCVPSRVYSVTWPNGDPIAADNTVYTIAIPSFVNQGGDSYRMFLDGTTGENELLDAVVMRQYIDFLGPIPALTPTTDGRIAKCSGCAPAP